MSVVETYTGKRKVTLAEDATQMHPEVVSLLSEGVALNTTGNVYVPKVNICICLNFVILSRKAFSHNQLRQLCIFLFFF